jgi:hypothetical protein
LSGNASRWAAAPPVQLISEQGQLKGIEIKLVDEVDSALAGFQSKIR